jgi:hypothetical protein
VLTRSHFSPKLHSNSFISILLTLTHQKQALCSVPLLRYLLSLEGMISGASGNRALLFEHNT